MIRWFVSGSLGRAGRVMMAGVIVLMALAQVLPLWTMILRAPQYKNGLWFNVYAGRLGGEIDIINTLNHYIGMQELDAANFVELQVIPILLWVGVAVALLGLITGWRWIVSLLVVAFPIAGLTGLVVLIRMLYDYGHDLEPDAPIRIQPFMPPVVGIQQLANFQTITLFSLGSLALLAAFGLLLYSLWKSSPWDPPFAHWFSRWFSRGRRPASA
jgi:hypothetical protein